MPVHRKTKKDFESCRNLTEEEITNYLLRMAGHPDGWKKSKKEQDEEKNITD